nr:retrotransposon protein, putative, Ty1-copia subclass [Tanacetum cinerariifolium]
MQVDCHLDKSQCPKSKDDKARMQNVPYALAVGSIMYVVRCIRPDVAFTQNITSRFQQSPGKAHWTTMKNILKYLRRTKDMFLVYGGNPDVELQVKCYCDAGFETNRDDTKSQTGKFHYVRECVDTGKIKMVKVHTDDNLADPFTKALAGPKLTRYARSMGLHPASSFMQKILSQGTTIGIKACDVPLLLLKSILLPRRICLGQESLSLLMNPSISNPYDLQNKNPSITETGASSSTILSKPAIKFVKAADRPTEIKANKVETVKKPAAKYIDLYRKTSKRQVNNARLKAMINRRNWVNDVKASGCWVWKPIKPNSASIILKRYDYLDVRGRSRWYIALLLVLLYVVFIAGDPPSVLITTLSAWLLILVVFFDVKFQVCDFCFVFRNDAATLFDVKIGTLYLELNGMSPYVLVQINKPISLLEAHHLTFFDIQISVRPKDVDRSSSVVKGRVHKRTWTTQMQSPEVDSTTQLDEYGSSMDVVMGLESSQLSGLSSPLLIVIELYSDMVVVGESYDF